MTNQFQGIILTGGKSSRMGRDKAKLKFKSTSFLNHEIKVLNACVDDLMLIGNTNEYKTYHAPVFNDIYLDKGPAAGIYTGLFHSNHDFNIVLSCDIPLIKSELIQLLINQYNGEDVLICEYKGKSHPMMGIYHKRILNHFKAAIESNQLRLLDIIEKLNWTFLKVPDNMAIQLSNINTEEEYNALIIGFNDLPAD